MRLFRRVYSCVFTAAIVLLVSPLPALAEQKAPQQQPTTKKAPAPRVPDTTRWDVEFHYGLGVGAKAGGGSGELPGAGEAFTTFSGTQSRRVPSWYFGDGSALLNEVLAALGRPERILPLDQTLTRQAVDEVIDNSFGGRVTHVMSKRLTLEISVDYAKSTYTILQTAIDGLAATNASYANAFSGVAGSGGVIMGNPSFQSAVTSRNGTGAEAVVTGSLVFGPKAARRFRPYVVVGGGVAMSLGGAESTLSGRFQFRLPSGAQVDERDDVTIKFGGGLGAVALTGAGLSWHLSRKSGVRADARVLLVQNHVGISVDTRPTVAESLPADGAITLLSPAIQFITHSSTGHKSSLNTSLSGFQTLRGHGFQTRVGLTVGYFFRF